jgi:hypothetical protein
MEASPGLGFPGLGDGPMVVKDWLELFSDLYP